MRGSSPATRLASDVERARRVPAPRSLIAPSGRGRAFHVVTTGVFLLAVAVIAVAANIAAHHPALRWRADATKTRAYSLSQQSQHLLQGLTGHWTIALVMVEDRANAPMRRQIDEVLDRFDQASAALTIVRIDPTQAQALPAFERLLSTLRATYREGMAEYDAAMDRAVAAFEQARLFSQQQGATLRALVDRLPAGESKQQLAQRLNLLALLADQGEAILKQVRDARRSDDAQPIPNYEVARSILAQTLTETAAQINDVAQLLEAALPGGAIEPAMRQATASLRDEARDLSARLAAAGDPLRHLPALEIASIGQQLQQGEAAIVIGPRRAAVVPSSQLFPKSNFRTTAEGSVTFDQRFRGEQLISAAIHSLLVPHMPMVVFVHAEDGSVLRQRDRGSDVVGVGQMLVTSGYVVREWEVGRGQRPRPEQGQAAVWVVMPPSQRTQLEPTERERQLLDAAQQLVVEGESVLLSFYPSLLPRFRQDDPWPALAEPLGLRPDTSRAIFETIRLSADTTGIERVQRLSSFPGEHPLSLALDGQQLSLALPVPLIASAQPGAGVVARTIGQIMPSDDRWLELQWNLEPKMLAAPKPEQRLGEPAAVVVVAERPHPLATVAGRRQRAVLVGAGGWMQSNVADVTMPLGGDRVALANPGNHELMLASVAWLAGMDEFIGPSAASRQVARLDGITPAVRTTWLWFTLAVMPALSIVMGLLVWMRRRS